MTKIRVRIKILAKSVTNNDLERNETHESMNSQNNLGLYVSIHSNLNFR